MQWVIPNKDKLIQHLLCLLRYYIIIAKANYSFIIIFVQVPIHTSFQSQHGYPCLAISSTTKTHSFCPTDCIFHNCNNNSNAGEGETSCSLDDPPKKKSKTPAATAFYKSNIEATLEGKSLWDEFCRRGTEMIVNRAGRYYCISYNVH